MYYPVPEISFKDGLWLTLTFYLQLCMKDQRKESIQSILIDSRFLKLHKDNRGKWRVENINQKHLKNFQAFSLNVAQEAADLSKA